MKEDVAAALEAVEKKMDARDRLYELLDRLNRQGKTIPPKYLAAWHKHLEDTRPWRDQVPKPVMMKLAKKLARNSHLTPEQKQKMAMKYLRKVTK